MSPFEVLAESIAQVRNRLFFRKWINGSIVLLLALTSSATIQADTTILLAPSDRVLRAELALADFVGTGKVSKEGGGKVRIRVTTHLLGPKIDQFDFIEQNLPEDAENLLQRLFEDSTKPNHANPSDASQSLPSKPILNTWSEYLFVGTKATSRFPIELGKAGDNQLERRVRTVLRAKWPSLPNDLKINRLQLSAYLNLGRLVSNADHPTLLTSKIVELDGNLATDRTLQLLSSENSPSGRPQLETYLDFLHAKYKRKTEFGVRTNSMRLNENKACSTPHFKRAVVTSLIHWLSVWNEFENERYLSKMLSASMYSKNRSASDLKVQCFPKAVQNDNIWEIVGFLD